MLWTAAETLSNFNFLTSSFLKRHYAVDMWLGAVIVSLIWRVMKPLEDNNMERNVKTIEDIRRRLPAEKFELIDVLRYGLPALVIFVQLAFFQGIMGNVNIVLFLIWGIVHAYLNGLQHYSVHIFYCAVFTGMGTYV